MPADTVIGETIHGAYCNEYVRAQPLDSSLFAARAALHNRHRAEC